MAGALVIGGDGQIGAALRARLSEAGWQTTATARHRDSADERQQYLDLSQDLSAWRPSERIAVAYLCAAVTSVAQCQTDPGGTRRVNVDALWAVSQTLLAAGAFVVFPSTSLVFDGSVPCRAATDPVSPLTEYGRQKAELERLLLGAGSQTAVVRLTKVLSPETRLLREWAGKLRAGEAIHPFSDMVMAPITLDLAAEALLRVGERQAAGITQVSAVDDITYAAAARRLAACLRASEGLIQPILASAAGLAPEVAPTHTTLDTTRLCEEIGLQAPQACETLETVYAELVASGR